MRDSILGSLLGCMVGDSIGLPYEGLSPERLNKLYKNIDHQRFLNGKGLISDDTDFRAGILEIIKCGGDTDTTAAILGSIIGARVHRKDIPEDWASNIISWPYGIDYMEDLCDGFEKNADKKNSIKEPSIIWVLLRNLAMYPIIIFHVIRRLLF